MGINIVGLGWQLALKVVSYIPGVIDSVERTIAAKGAEKQAAAVEMIGEILEATEGVAGRDLLDNAEVEAAAKAVIDAVVHLANIVEAVKAKQPPAKA